MLVGGVEINNQEQKNTKAIKYITKENQTSEIYEDAIFKDWKNITKVNQDILSQKLCNIAIKKCWEAIEFIPEKFHVPQN
jgi:hypothetical protein